jgi:hypothetical protein
MTDLSVTTWVEYTTIDVESALTCQTTMLLVFSPFASCSCLCIESDKVSLLLRVQFGVMKPIRKH